VTRKGTYCEGICKLYGVGPADLPWGDSSLLSVPHLLPTLIAYKMEPTLLVLAAGMGSRYGGLKQIDPIGPGGETIIDYSVYDALRAGFRKLVFVIRREIDRPFREAVGNRFEDKLEVGYVYQELDKLPSTYALASRKKPWGTAHAVLMGAEAIDGSFAVINGDDFYGRNAFRLLAEHFRSGSDDYTMVGFVLKNTLSDFGTVARGVCSARPDGYLESVVELTKIARNGLGIKYTDPAGVQHPLSGNEIVSLNTWGFNPGIFQHLRDEFLRFLQSHQNEDKAEFFIPTVVNNLVAAGKAQVKVLTTSDSWFGITYKEDRPKVVESLRQLVSRGDYPERLWARE